MEQEGVVRKRRGLSPVWILPIVAAVISGWLLYKSYSEAGIDIEVFFADGSGIVPEKTQVVSMGIPLGKVKRMEPDIGNRRVKVIIEMDRSLESYLVEDLKFWLVKPEVSARRVTGLETILTGSYIGVQRGESTRPARVFTALEKSPPLHSETPGLHLELRSTALRSIQEGSPIYFKNIEIGYVKNVSLEADESVLIRCFIRPEYARLIRTESRFFNASGITMSGSLPDLRLRMESLSALFIGGIVAMTPEPLRQSPPARSGDVFTLFEDFESAKYGVPMTLTLASGTEIREGATKVIYRGIDAGIVREISINNDARRTVTAHVLLDPRAEIILREGTRFWLVRPEISIAGVKNLGTLLSGPHITFEPGEGAFKDSFEILPEPPLTIPQRPGTLFRLSSADTPSSGVGAPVYYKKMQIGELLGSELAADNRTVVTSIYIYQRYTELVRADSVFIEAGGISIEADLSGFRFSMAPLVSTFKGGIDLVNPPGRTVPSPGGPNQLYPLYRDFDSALEDLPVLMPEGLYIKLTSDDLGSHRIGTPIHFKKMRVGQVIGYEYSRQDKVVELSCFIAERYRDLVTSESRFYNASGIRVEGGLAGLAVETESLESIIAGGIGFIDGPAKGAPVANDHRFQVYQSLHAARISDHVDITVRFENIGQLKEGAEVRHRGVKIGEVEKTSFDENLSTIIATLNIDRRYEGFFRKDTKIWLSRPLIRFNKVENVESVLFGLSVIVEPGSGMPSREFTGLDRAPHPFFTTFKGLGLILETNQLGSLDIGSPVYYRRVRVGEVSGYDLAFNFRDVLVYVTIEERYAPLIRKNTRFWNASGVKVSGGVFSGVTVSTESLEALVAGGIALATPGKAEMGPRVETGYRFRLHDKPEAGWLDWSPEIFVVEEEKPAPVR